MPRKRVGVLTGGGDCPGLNAVIRAVVKSGVTHHGMELTGIRDAFNGLLTSPFQTKTMDRDSVRGILTKGGTVLGTTNRGDPFAFPTQTANGITFVDRSDDLLESLRILQLDGLIVIGGDGTLIIAQKLREKGVNIIGVPKTIDNDIAATDYTFGFHTAVEVATEAIDRLHSTAESHDRVMVVEVMGRDCGWIALHAGIAAGADAILIPEVPYDIAKVCDKVRRRQAAGRFFSIVVVAEGAAPKGGTKEFLEEFPNAGGMRRYGGAGSIAAAAITETTGLETRVVVLGHLLRGGTPSGFDRLLATRYGAKAADLAQNGEWGRMVALSGTGIVAVDLAAGIGTLKRVDPKGPIVADAKTLGIEFGDTF